MKYIFGHILDLVVDSEINFPIFRAVFIIIEKNEILKQTNINFFYCNSIKLIRRDLKLRQKTYTYFYYFSFIRL